MFLLPTTLFLTSIFPCPPFKLTGMTEIRNVPVTVVSVYGVTFLNLDLRPFSQNNRKPRTTPTEIHTKDPTYKNVEMMAVLMNRVCSLTKSVQVLSASSARWSSS